MDYSDWDDGWDPTDPDGKKAILREEILKPDAPLVKQYLVLGWHTDCGGGSGDLLTSATTIAEAYAYIRNSKRPLSQVTSYEGRYPEDWYEIVDGHTFVKIAEFDCIRYNAYMNGADGDPLCGDEMRRLFNAGLLTDE